MKITHEVLNLTTTHPFIIARGGQSTWRTLMVKVTDKDGVEGWGEAAPSGLYGETVDSNIAVLDRLRPIVEEADSWSIEALEAAMHKNIAGNGALKSAISSAVHDIIGKKLGIPLWKLWGLDPKAAPKSSFTIGIAPDIATTRARVREASQYPILKVKLGSDRDKQIILAVREEAPGKTIRVDANCAWTPKHTLEMIPYLKELGVEFVEQPLPGHDLAGMKFVRERSALPIVADESCVTSKDIKNLVGVVDGINIKVAKCGGLGEAIKMVHIARAFDMLVMTGCMIESSLGISASAHFAPLLDMVDMDGAALLKDDPFIGATIADGVTTLPTGPGLGVTRR
jgi:L-alanine-DL-glutamate epimerase-like enolase superfamily enzyme